MKHQTNTLAKWNADENKATFNPVFTSYKTANEILNGYRLKLRKQGITFLVEGGGIQKTVLSDEKFARLLKHALDMAYEEAANENTCRIRSIRIKSMQVQRKVFLKVEYSSEHDQDANNRHFQSMEEILLKKAGFVKIENGEETNVLMIAIPVKG